MPTPAFFSDLRKAARGAVVGAALALGPAKFAALRRVWRVLAWVGWAVLSIYLISVIAVMLGG